MCDTLYKKINNGFIFGKNSDRSPNEPNLSVFYPAKDVTEKEVKCTYISVPAAPHTNALLLIQPSWMWGGEMGVNEHGVVIGNEAVFTHSRGKKEPRLLGMDLLRLGLERGRTAAESLRIIVQFLETYGQGGNCGFDKPFYYDNSFLIADDNSAYVLETSGRDWVSREIKDYYNISNRLSLDEGYSEGTDRECAFARRHREPIYSHFSGSFRRAQAGERSLAAVDFDVLAMMNALRQHYREDNKLFRKGSIKSVCMHKSFLGDHTTSSLILVANNGKRTIWLTGCSTPCLSLYKPLYFSNPLPPVFFDQAQSFAYWLKREYLVRAVYAGLIDATRYRGRIAVLQEQFINEEKELLAKGSSPEEMALFSKKCSQLEEELIDSYRGEIEKIRKNPQLLPPLWRKATLSLGKNVFERDLKQRIGK
jgi:secernin